jgi:hypothetical protein
MEHGLLLSTALARFVHRCISVSEGDAGQTQALALNACLSGCRRPEGDCGRVMTSEGIGVNSRDGE